MEDKKKRLEELKAKKEKEKVERIELTKKIREEAQARKAEEKERRRAEHDQRVEEARAIKESKAAERKARHTALANEQEKQTILKKQREVTIEFSDFVTIKSALTKELQKFGEIESFKRTLSGCEARFSDHDGAQAAISAGEVETTINLTVQMSEIKQHSIHFFPTESETLDTSYLKSVKKFFNDQCNKACPFPCAHVSVVTKRRGAVIVGFNNSETRNHIAAIASENWKVNGCPIGAIGNGFPPKNAYKKQKITEGN